MEVVSEKPARVNRKFFLLAFASVIAVGCILLALKYRLPVSQKQNIVPLGGSSTSLSSLNNWESVEHSGDDREPGASCGFTKLVQDPSIMNLKQFIVLFPKSRYFALSIVGIILALLVVVAAIVTPLVLLNMQPVEGIPIVPEVPDVVVTHPEPDPEKASWIDDHPGLLSLIIIAATLIIGGSIGTGCYFRCKRIESATEFQGVIQAMKTTIDTARSSQRINPPGTTAIPPERLCPGSILPESLKYEPNEYLHSLNIRYFKLLPENPYQIILAYNQVVANNQNERIYTDVIQNHSILQVVNLDHIEELAKIPLDTLSRLNSNITIFSKTGGI